MAAELCPMCGIWWSASPGAEHRCQQTISTTTTSLLGKMEHKHFATGTIVDVYREPEPKHRADVPVDSCSVAAYRFLRNAGKHRADLAPERADESGQA